MFTMLAASKMNGGRDRLHELSGIPPLSFTSKGKPLTAWSITGNTVQNGTPTPDNPIMLQGTGDLETVGTKAGQYKIPILSANITTNVYLGEVETTRKIKKYEFTGQENFFTDTSTLYNNTLYFGTRVNFAIFGSNRESLNSHFYTAPKGNNPQVLKYECSGFNPVQSYSDFYYMRINLDTIGSPSASENVAVPAFKTWLATQYAAGTPVTVWYVLSTPKTGIVNEPLQKIGDYADTLSMEQAGVQIPTLNGTTVIDVDTAVKPESMTIKYRR